MLSWLVVLNLVRPVRLLAAVPSVLVEYCLSLSYVRKEEGGLLFTPSLARVLASTSAGTLSLFWKLLIVARILRQEAAYLSACEYCSKFQNTRKVIRLADRWWSR